MSGMQTFVFAEARPPGEGPWNREPDKAQWVDEATGLDCLVVRNRQGALCGYVGCPPGHPWYGVDLPDIVRRHDVEVHGGLNFTSFCQKGAEDGWAVCHVPEPGRPDKVWWVGFDCSHAFDINPSIEHLLREIGAPTLLEGAQYRDFAYAVDQVTRLATQAAATHGEGPD